MRNKTRVICKNIRANVPCSIFSVLEKKPNKRPLEHDRLKIVRLVANVFFEGRGFVFVLIVFNFKIQFMTQLKYEYRSRSGTRIMF